MLFHSICLMLNSIRFDPPFSYILSRKRWFFSFKNSIRPSTTHNVRWMCISFEPNSAFIDNDRSDHFTCTAAFSSKVKRQWMWCDVQDRFFPYVCVCVLCIFCISLRAVTMLTILYVCWSSAFRLSQCYYMWKNCQSYRLSKQPTTSEIHNSSNNNNNKNSNK